MLTCCQLELGEGDHKSPPAPLELAEGDHVGSVSAAIKSLPMRFSSLSAAVKSLPMRFSVFLSDLASRICLFDFPESGCPRSKDAGVCVAVVRVAARGFGEKSAVPAMPCQRRRMAAQQLRPWGQLLSSSAAARTALVRASSAALRAIAHQDNARRTEHLCVNYPHHARHRLTAYLTASPTRAGSPSR